MDFPRIHTGEMFVCSQGQLKIIHQADCVVSIMMDKPTICTQNPIKLPNVKLNKINNQYLIIISIEYNYSTTPKWKINLSLEIGNIP